MNLTSSNLMNTLNPTLITNDESRHFEFHWWYCNLLRVRRYHLNFYYSSNCIHTFLQITPQQVNPMGKNLNLSPFMPFPQHLLNEKDQTILSVEERVIKYKQKKIRQQMKNNTKSNQGFGYTYKPFQFNLNKWPTL